MKSCTIGKKHAWNFVRNKTVVTKTAKSISLSARGLYKCQCGAAKYGPVGREPTAAPESGDVL